MGRSEPRKDRDKLPNLPMIIDCYTHIWDSPTQLGRLAESIDNPVRVPASRSQRRGALNAGTARHLASAQEIDTTIVLGFKSEYLGAEVPNDVVASYVQTHPDKLIGFAGIDPSSPVEAIEEMRRAREELGMKGIAIAPAAQDQHPCSSNSELVYEKATEWNMPVLFHPGIQIARESRLEYAQPVLLDEVARNFPKLKIIIAHLGYPWMTETLVLLAKHDKRLLGRELAAAPAVAGVSIVTFGTPVRCDGQAAVRQRVSVRLGDAEHRDAVQHQSSVCRHESAADPARGPAGHRRERRPGLAGNRAGRRRLRCVRASAAFWYEEGDVEQPPVT